VETAFATLRSYGVGHYVCVQSSTQIVNQYGRELAATIQDQLATKIVLNGAAADDAKAFSARCGEIVEHHAARSWAGGGLFRAPNLSYTPERRPLVHAAEIIHGQGQVLVSTRGLPPIRLAARRYYMDPAVVRRLEEDQRQFEQRGGQAPDRLVVTPNASGDEPDRGERDVPPPKCSKDEWDTAAASLRVALWSMEDDLFQLVTGRAADLDAIRETWRLTPSKSSPARYARITDKERAQSPAVAAYVNELAVRLELRDENAP
jgi:type IV secretory pathway TraG/TraD family ATPase VirD4